MVHQLIWIYALILLISVNLSSQRPTRTTRTRAPQTPATALFKDHTFNDSGLMKYFPFGLRNQTNQMGNNSAMFKRKNFTLIHYRLWWATDKYLLFLKGPMVTRVMPSIYIFIILISLPLNGLAVVTFTCRIREKKPAVIFMGHLACVDLLFTLLLPLKIHYQLNASDWLFGEAACRLLSAAYYGNMYCSILLMVCMSVDRLLGVVFPIASLTWRSTRKATCVCVLIGLLALIGIVPLLSMKQTIKIENVGVTCFDMFADPSIKIYLLVFITLLCICFFLPLVVILVSYSIIIYVLCAKHGHSATSSSSSDNQRRAAIMATAVLTEFVVCFVPSNGILFYHCFTCSVMGSCSKNTYMSYMLAVCLGSSSVFLDPLLYYYGSSQFREQIRSVFWGCKAKRANIP